MTTPIKTITDPMECLNRINGWSASAMKSLANGNVKGARMSVGFIKAHIKQFEELTK